MMGRENFFYQNKIKYANQEKKWMMMMIFLLKKKKYSSSYKREDK